MNTDDFTVTFTTGARRIAQCVIDAVRVAVASAISARRQRAALHELKALDNHGLHDIGVDRSELQSLVAEVVGAASATRRRLPLANAARAAAWRQWPGT